MSSRTVPALSCLLVVCLAALPGCGRCGADPVASAPVSDVSEPAALKPVAEPDAGPSVVTPSAAVSEALADLKQRPLCNRVMGCAPAVRLAQHGDEAVAALVEAIEGEDRRAGYWLIRAIDLVGQLGDAAVLPVLYPLLPDKRWEVRAHAGLALARLAEPESEPVIAKALTQLSPGAAGDAAPGDGTATGVTPKRDDLPLRAALLYALSRLDAAVGGQPAREALAAALPVDREHLGRLNPGHYAFLAEIVREARLTEAAPLARWAAIHKDRFVRLAGLAALGALEDQQGVPYAITRLDDELPSVRRASLAALRRITGLEDLTEAEHWKAWCEHRDCLAPLRAP